MRETVLDTSIFERTRTQEEARRARKLEHIYHVGQEKVWDGRAVLEGLIQKHGKPRMTPEQKKATTRIFSSLMWGELAAWKISLQLADRLDSLEARMAATSQAHDEARHFYVLHDYLEALGLELPDLDPATRFLLESVLTTESVAEKLVGMQLFIETIAITLFRTVRELSIEPVLTELLPYYERDESRHIGLGIQHAPELLKNLSARDFAQLTAFQTKLLLTALVSLKRMELPLRRLGVDPRAIADEGTERLLKVVDELTAANQGRKLGVVAGPIVARSFGAALELTFPRQGRSRIAHRLFDAGRALVYDAA
ncbi:MAG: ferritin-like domain-containing protein [Myxococcota bacterium]